jgi:hypothetical protein
MCRRLASPIPKTRQETRDHARKMASGRLPLAIEFTRSICRYRAPYRLLPCFSGFGLDFGGLDFFGGGLECELCFGCDSECGVLCGRDSFAAGLLSLRSAEFEVELFEGGVNDRNPSFELPRLPAAGDDARASLGDIAGAWYSPPADLAATAEWLLKSPALEVAAIDGRPWFSDAKFARFWLARCSCWVCAASGAVCGSFIAVRSAAVGVAATPPSPPLNAV